MISYQHILAVLDCDSSALYSLQKALTLSTRTQAKITVIQREASTTNALAKLWHRPGNQSPLAKAQKVIEQYRAQGVEIEIKHSSERKISTTVFSELEQAQYDLVIINYRHRSTLFHEFFFADEWRIMRESSVPVMLVGNKSWSRQGHILTAIETDDVSHAHSNFNQQLLEETEHIACLLHSDIHLVNCFQEDNLSLAVEPSADNTHHNDRKDNHWKSLTDSAKPLHINPDHIHLKEGLPDHVIPDLANRYNINMVIVGTGEHQGLLNQLKGHTSEQIIDQISCDMFAINPVANGQSSAA